MTDMIQKVLKAEDHESVNISVQLALEEMGILDADHVYYCDDALVRVRKVKEGGAPYDLLITDLSFNADHRAQRLAGGAELIAAVREMQPELRVLVFSVEGKMEVIKALYSRENIDGFVQKGRNDARELKMAIEKIAGNERYWPMFFVLGSRQSNVYEFTSYETTIIRLMAQGVKQKDIPDHLRAKGIKPDGLSSVEKHLSRVREALNFTKNEQLVAYCVSMGIV